MDKPVYRETLEAADLLRTFNSIQVRTESDDEYADARAVFFDKEYLTMAEFLAPIGAVLTRTDRSSGGLTIEKFFSTSLKTASPRAESDREKLQELFSRELESQAASLDQLKQIESIKAFLSRLPS
jgi:hypothetical protein